MRMVGRIHNAWRGRLPLPLTFWVLGVGGNMSFLALLILIDLLGGGRLPGLLWIIYGISLLWFIFVFGAIWRAAGAYRGPRIWAILARVGVSIGILRMTAEALVLVAKTG
jgi:hypothetical protein